MRGIGAFAIIEAALSGVGIVCIHQMDGKRGRVIMHCIQHWGLYKLPLSRIDSQGAYQMVTKKANIWI